MFTFELIMYPCALMQDKEPPLQPLGLDFFGINFPLSSLLTIVISKCFLRGWDNRTRGKAQAQSPRARSDPRPSQTKRDINTRTPILHLSTARGKLRAAPARHSAAARAPPPEEYFPSRFEKSFFYVCLTTCSYLCYYRGSRTGHPPPPIGLIPKIGINPISALG